MSITHRNEEQGIAIEDCANVHVRKSKRVMIVDCDEQVVLSNCRVLLINCEVDSPSTFMVYEPPREEVK